jgi:hypothetical protein
MINQFKYVMGKSGKRYRRKKRNATPSAPNELSDDQVYGIITKYLGGHTKNMLVTTCNDDGSLAEITCSLKGSLRPRGCKQRAVKGSFVVVEDIGASKGVVVIILNSGDNGSIPGTVYDTLNRVGSGDADDEDAVGFTLNDTYLDDWSDDDVAFDDGHASDLPDSEDDIDAI